MSVNFKYTTPPTLTSNSLGYLALDVPISSVPFNNSNIATFSLAAGTYMYALNCNVYSETSNASTVISLINNNKVIVSSSYQFYTIVGGAIGNLSSSFVINITSETSFVVNAQSAKGDVTGEFGRIQVIRIA
jgi:hypothetical protein